MTSLGNDKLWPVLAAMFTLLAGALVLQVVAQGREADPRIISIAQSTGVVLADDDNGNEDEGGLVEDSAPVDDDHAHARIAAHRGELDTAIELFRRAAANHSDDGNVAAELGYWLLVDDQPRAALAALHSAAKLHPHNAWIALGIGTAYRRTGQPVEAEASYRRALQEKADYGAARVALGSLLRERGRSADAIAILELAASSGGNEERARALVALGRAYVAVGRTSDAQSAFERAIERAPAAAEIRVGVARGCLAAGWTDRAIEVLQQTITLAPDVPQVHNALASALERKGDRTAAEASYQRALRLDPKNRFARRRLFRLALDAEDYGRARAEVDALLDDSPGVPEHLFLAGLLAAREGKRDEARKRYGDAIAAAKGNYPEAYLNLGLLEKRAKKYDAAVAAYDKAIELRPRYREAINNLGLAQKAAGKLAQAEATFRRALKVDAGYAGAWLNLGQTLSAQERYPEAIEAFDKALEARPGYKSARLDLAVTLRKAGRVDEAVKTYRALVGEHPRYVSAWHNLAIALEALGKLEDAEAAYRKALALNPDHLPSLRNLAQLLARAGRRGDAMTTVQELLDRVPADEDARLLLAQLHLDSGDTADCQRDVHLVLARSPDNAAATDLLHQCSAHR